MYCIAYTEFDTESESKLLTGIIQQVIGMQHIIIELTLQN